MAWTTPRTWQTDEIVDANMLNEQIRDNLNALKSPPSQQIVRDNGGAYSTTSTTFVPVDSTNLKVALTTHGGDVMVGFTAGIAADSSTARHMSLDLRIDGSGAWAADQGFDGGIITTAVTSTINQAVSFGPVLITGLSAGGHTFEVLWKMNSGTGYMRSSTSDSDYRLQTPVVFWAREVS